MIDPKIPANLQDFIAREIEAGESVIWSAMPKPVFFNAKSTGAFVFGIPWTLFIMFWMAGAAGFKIPNFQRGDNLFPLFGIPFFLIGIGMLSSPLWARRNSKKTAYVVTDRRAITFDGGRSVTIRSYPPEKLTDLFRREHSDGTGDVIINRQVWRGQEDTRQMEELGFLRIRDAKKVEEILRALAEQTEPRPE